MKARQRLNAVSVCVLASIVATSSAMASPHAGTSNPAVGARRAAFDLLQLALTYAAPMRPLIRAVEGGEQLSKGTDGRLTFAVFGSDSRESNIARTDAIMIFSVKGDTISAASIPRDTARIPNPAGGTFSGKVNGILRQLRGSSSSTSEALAKFERVLEDLLRIEIDYNVLIWFNGFTTLVDKIDPIRLSIGREIRDPKHVDDRDGPKGVYFPQSSAYSLYAWNTISNGNPYCNGAYKTDPAPINSSNYCRRALPFVRSRKGPANDDWVRARRQQDFIAATIKAVSQSELSALVNTGQGEGGGKWWTNFPITLSNAQDLYNELDGASLQHQVVFKPSTYASRISGTSAYELKLSAVRAWTAQYMS